MVISARIAMSEQGFSTQEEYAYSRELELDEYTLWENELYWLLPPKIPRLTGAQPDLRKDKKTRKEA
jgi:hypothetical protein